MNVILFDALLLAGAAAALFLFIGLARRYALLGSGVLLSSLFILWEVPNPPPIAELGGLQVYFNDVASTTLFLVGLLNWKHLSRKLSRSTVLWVLFGCLIGFSLVRGFIEHGPGASFNEARPIIWVFFVFTWAISVQWSARDRRRLIFMAGWGLTAVAAYHALVYGVGSSASVVDLDDATRTGRVLVADQALVLAVCAAMLLLRGVEKSRLTLFSALAFLVVSVISQHRSVWVALAIGLLAVVLLSPGWASRARASLISLATVFVAYLIASYGLLGDLVSSVANSATDFRSINARSSSWEQLVQQLFDEGPFAVLFGLSFGSGFVRIEPNGLVQTYSPHNWYVLLLLRVGLVGLAAWVLVTLHTILRARNASAAGFSAVAAVSAYAFFYSVPWQIAPFIGTSLASRDRLTSDDHLGLADTTAAART